MRNGLKKTFRQAFLSMFEIFHKFKKISTMYEIFISLW